MTGDNSPGKDKKFKSTKSQEVFPKQHLSENSDMFTIQKKGLVFLFLVVSFLMCFSNLPSFYMIIYMVYLFALRKVSPSHPTKISKGNTFSPLKDTTLRRTLGHTKARVTDLLVSMTTPCWMPVPRRHAPLTRKTIATAMRGLWSSLAHRRTLGCFAILSGKMAPSVKQMTEAKGFAFWGWFSVTLVGWTR